MNLAELLVLALGTWRLTSLATCEDGPGDVLAKARHVVGIRYDQKSVAYGTNPVARALACFWCASVWFAATIVVAHVLWPEPTYYGCLALALSGAAILVQKVVDG